MYADNVATLQNIYGGDKRGLYGSGAHSRGSMIYGRTKRKWPKFLIILILLALIIFLCIRQFACGGIFSSDEQANESAAIKQLDAFTALENYVADVGNGPTGTITISAIGDCTLATDDHYATSNSFVNKYAEVNSPGYFFGNVSRYLREDNLTICNFEGTLSNGGTRAEGKQFCFRGKPAYAKILTEGSVEAANLANNHTFDFGMDAYEDTKKYLTNNKITNFGYDRVNTYQYEDIIVGLYGVDAHSTSYDEATDLMKENVKALQDAGCHIIIGCIHWGNEGEYVPESGQVNLAHAAIDAGTNLVLGTHPHVLQGVEQYKDSYICYSLGNFCFGGNDNPMDYDTMIFQQTFTLRNGEIIIDESTLSDVKIVPCSVSSSDSINDYRPTPLTGSKAKTAITDLNGYSKKLAGTSVLFDTKLDEQGWSELKQIGAKS